MAKKMTNDEMERMGKRIRDGFANPSMDDGYIKCVNCKGQTPVNAFVSLSTDQIFLSCRECGKSLATIKLVGNASNLTYQYGTVR